MHQRMVERYAPPSILLSPDDKVLHLSEHAGRFLIHPGGSMTTNIFKLVREELRVDLRGLVHEARFRREPSSSKPISVRMGDKVANVALLVRPAMDPPDDGFLLVIFDERKAPDAELPHSAAQIELDSKDADAARELESELVLVRQQLQAVIEEFETSQEEMKASNEELQSTNEELRSTMEELETSKEELQSMNEELQTVNQENRHKVEELAQLSSDLQNLLSSTTIATLFLDREMRILRFTPQLGELFNVRQSDRGRPLSDLTHALLYDGLLTDALSVLDRLVPIEREVQDSSGRWYLTSLRPYRVTEDRISGIVITFVEITRVKRVEEELRRSEERLRQKTAELEGDDRQKEVFIAILGHELRNPLGAISGAVKVLEQGARQPAEILPVITAQLGKLTRLVDDLLDLSRVTHGKVQLRKTSVELPRVVRGAAEGMRDAVRAKKQVLELDIEEGLWVMGDAQRLEQVVANLLSNASKCSPEQSRIDLVLRRDEGEAVLLVKDQGRGLQRQQLRSIFEAFAQENPEAGGLGVGLTLASSLVELHGGSIRAESEGLGRGSVFVVRIPLADTAGAEVTPPPESRDGKQLPWPARVLVVDDARDAADMLKLLLKSYGADVACAYTGTEGLEKARQWMPEVALIDIAMPDMSGYEVAQRLRAQQNGDRLLLVAVTGFGDARTEEKVRQAGFDRQMLKPVDPKRLLPLLVEHWEKTRA